MKKRKEKGNLTCVMGRFHLLAHLHRHSLSPLEPTTAPALSRVPDLCSQAHLPTLHFLPAGACRWGLPVSRTHPRLGHLLVGPGGQLHPLPPHPDRTRRRRLGVVGVDPSIELRGIYSQARGHPIPSS
jgi:hypothetical protein